jgi:ketosteroid isomerase-like protein
MPDTLPLQQIHDLLNREAIKELRIRYSALLDGGETDRLGEVFTDDAELLVTVGAFRGLEEIKSNLRAAYASFDTQQRNHYPFVHAVVNHEVTLTSASTATGCCYLLDFVTDRSAGDHPFLLVGRYIDKYARIDDEWRITRSELDVLWPTE